MASWDLSRFTIQDTRKTSPRRMERFSNLSGLILDLIPIQNNPNPHPKSKCKHNIETIKPFITTYPKTHRPWVKHGTWPEMGLFLTSAIYDRVRSWTSGSFENLRTGTLTLTPNSPSPNSYTHSAWPHNLWHTFHGSWTIAYNQRPITVYFTSTWLCHILSSQISSASSPLFSPGP